MTQLKISEALLFMIRESNGLPPDQPGKWITQLKQAGFIDFELREMTLPDDMRKPHNYNIPHIIITEKGSQAIGHLQLKK